MTHGPQAYGPSLPCPHQSKMLRKAIEKIARRGPTPEEVHRHAERAKAEKRQREIDQAYFQLAADERRAS